MLFISGAIFTILSVLSRLHDTLDAYLIGTPMKSFIRFLTVLLLAGWLAACSNSPVIRSDYDPSADFAAYRTFAFMEPLGTNQAGYTTLLTERLKRATMRQMEARGYSFSAVNPDLLVNFQSQINSKTEYVPPPPMPWGPNYYGYRMGFYGPWPGYAFGPDMIQYTEGVLNVDLIDAKRRQMVWEGIGTAVLDDLQQASSEDSVDAMIAAIFARYPFVAGSASKASK